MKAKEFKNRVDKIIEKYGEDVEFLRYHHTLVGNYYSFPTLLVRFIHPDHDEFTPENLSLMNDFAVPTETHTKLVILT